MKKIHYNLWHQNNTEHRSASLVFKSEQITELI